MIWAKVIDQERCIGCHACTTACKSENEVPLGVTRTYVKYVDVGVFPQARRAFQVTRCNQCDDAPCTAACPYDAIFINPEDHSAEKCNFCAHRLDVGLEPACVVVCPTEAILVGDLDDPASQVARIVHREAVAVRRPEKETRPKLFYRGAHQATLDPLAARRPPGGLFSWSQQRGGGEHVVSGHPFQAGHTARAAPAGRPEPAGGAEPATPAPRPRAGNSAAAAVLAYDVSHSVPWDWRVSLYTLTKGIAAGVYLVAVLLMALGRLSATSRVWLFDVPILAGAFLAVTGALLVWDLEHPARFYLIFTRPQWRSWLVRGAFLIAGYAAVLAVHLLAAFAHRPQWTRELIWVGLPLALLTAVYTAFLFAQAKARDLWQNPLLPPHLTLQSVLAGAAVLAIAALFEPLQPVPLLAILAAAGVLHLAVVAGECTMPHGTAHAHLATLEMLRGRLRGWFWAGIALAAAGAALAWAAAATAASGSATALAVVAAGHSASVAAAGAGLFSAALAETVAVFAGSAAAILGLAGLLAHEHAYVQAGQSVPLA